jgi:hypothetical protein
MLPRSIAVLPCHLGWGTLLKCNKTNHACSDTDMHAIRLCCQFYSSTPKPSASTVAALGRRRIHLDPHKFSATSWIPSKSKALAVQGLSPGPKADLTTSSTSLSCQSLQRHLWHFASLQLSLPSHFSFESPIASWFAD